MPVITKEDTRALFGGYRQSISKIFFGAWEDWTGTDYPGTWRCKRSRANFVWEQIIARAHLEFLNDSRVQIVRKNESYVFLLDNQIAFRFKKSDEAGMTANVPTQASMEFSDPQCDLPGLPDVSRVDIVYVVNKLETAIADILVVGRDKNEIAWTFSLLEDADDDSVVVPFPINPVRPTDPSKVRQPLRLVRTKDDEAAGIKEDVDGQS